MHQLAAREDHLRPREPFAPKKVSGPLNGPLASVVSEFMRAQDVSAASKQTYRRQLNRFVLWLHDTGRVSDARGLTRSDILAFRDALHDTGLTANTVSGYVSAVRRLFAWLAAEGIYPNIAKDVRSPKRPKGFRRDALAGFQVRQVLASIDTATLTGLRDFALINLLARTALRTVEVARAQRGDLRHQAGELVLWVQGKGRPDKDDFVLLTAEAAQPLQDYLVSRGMPRDTEPLICSHSDRNPGEPLTTRSISRIAKNAFRRAGLDSPRITAHSRRHTAITAALANGASLQQAQAMARHTSVTTTMVYAHNIDRVRNGAEKRIVY